MVDRLDDDELTRLLTESSPARTPRDAKPDADAMRMMYRIMAENPRPVRKSPSARLAWGAVATAGAAGTAVVLALMAPGTAAVAVTPVPLAFTSAGSSADVVSRAQDLLTADEAGAVPLREVESVSWSLAVDVDAQRSEVIPQWTTLAWNADLSGHLSVLEGEGYWPSSISADEVEAVKTDTPLVELSFEAGQFTTPVAVEPGESLADMVAMLVAFGMPADPDAGDVIIALYTALDQWTLTDTQHSELLDYLIAQDGVQVQGATTDRLGRAVDALRVDSDRGVAYTVLLSQQSGRIVGIETTQTVDDGIVPAGAVVSYRLWGIDEGSSE